MIEQVDEALKHCLLEHLKKNEASTVEISFSRPGETGTAPTVNLFLLRLQEDVQARAQAREVSRKPGDLVGTLRRGPVTITLEYLVSAHHPDPQREHSLLSQALIALIRQGGIASEGMAALGIERADLAVAQPDGLSIDSARLWHALGSPLRASFGITATLTFNPFPAEDVRLVRETTLATRAIPDGPGSPAHLASRKVSVAGSVVSEPDGLPLAGAEVEIIGRADATRTDERGFFFFEEIPQGPVRLRVSHPAYTDAEIPAVAPAPGRTDELKPVSVKLGRVAPTLAPEGWSGPIRDAQGKVGAHIPVRIGLQTAVTDRNGFYHLHAVPSESTPLEANWPGIGWTLLATSCQEIERVS